MTSATTPPKAVALDRPLLLVGCGKMGGAMLAGWLDSAMVAAGVFIVDPAGGGEFADRAGVTVYPDMAVLPVDLDPAVVVLAVKPQHMDAVVAGYARFARPATVFLSIAAGKTIGYFERALGAEAAIVRAMPNTPAAIGAGITVLCPNARAGAEQAALCECLLSAVGETAMVADESLIDAVTALSGGGPAYVFLLIECMAEAGVAAGLPKALAERLALVTVAGAGRLAFESGQPPAVLRENVTSPGGTTLEALKVLMAEDGMAPLFERAIRAATERSRALAF